MQDEQLIQAAGAARAGAYAPYSKFAVGAAILLADGSVVTGSNIENAAYGETICAERVAVVKAVSEGQRAFLKIAIIADTDEYCVPCGACRQVLREFSPEITVLCANKDGVFQSFSLAELLPHSFALNEGV